MDEITPVDAIDPAEPRPVAADAVPPDARPAQPALAAPAVSVAPTKLDADRDDADAAAGSGSSGELEALHGAVIAAAPGDEAAALRRSLALDDRPESAVPSQRQEAAETAILRAELTAAPPVRGVAGDAEVPVDPTTAYDVHDAAVEGEPIARAIEHAAEQGARRESARADAATDRGDRRHEPADEHARATQLSGAAAAAHFGAGRPPAPPDAGEEEDPAGDERRLRIRGTDQVAPVPGHDPDGDAGQRDPGR